MGAWFRGVIKRCPESGRVGERFSAYEFFEKSGYKAPGALPDEVGRYNILPKCIHRLRSGKDKLYIINIKRKSPNHTRMVRAFSFHFTHSDLEVQIRVQVMKSGIG